MSPTASQTVISVANLQRQAEAFDAISLETGAHYSAATFVEWLKMELCVEPSRRSFPAGIPGRKTPTPA